jgi:DNA-binding PadR family transcriptional regulator
LLSNVELKIGGTLQWKVLATFIEGSFSGSDIMKKLKLRSPGTIYPVLRTLREKGLIESAPERAAGKKLYVLSKDGVQEIKNILLEISRRYFSRYAGPYTSSVVEVLRDVIELDHYANVLSTLTYEPIKEWLRNTDATYLNIFDTPPSTYDLVLSGLVCTLMAYGCKKDAFTAYLSSLVKSLQPRGTLIMVELEQTDNLIVSMFFQDVLGFSRVPGVSENDLRDVLKSYGVKVGNVYRKRGMLISTSTTPTN